MQSTQLVLHRGQHGLGAHLSMKRSANAERTEAEAWGQQTCGILFIMTARQEASWSTEALSSKTHHQFLWKQQAQLTPSPATVYEDVTFENTHASAHQAWRSARHCIQQ